MSTHSNADAFSSKNQSTKPASEGRTFSEQAGRVGHEAQELGRVAMSQAGEVASNLRDKGQEALETGAEKAKGLKSDFDKVVAAHPMKSVLIAMGVGAMLGCALRRRA